jgi:putative ABC transport system permease protein
MSWFRFFRRDYWDNERRQELESYLAIEIEDNLARGLSPDEARRAAHRKLGNPTRIREEIREMNTLGLIDTTWQDLRYGTRLLRRNPSFAVVAILSIALGAGANTAIFQIVNAVRLKTLPVERAHELAEIRITHSPNGRTGAFISRRASLTYPLWQQIRDQQQAFSSVMAWGTVTLNLANGGEARPANGLFVSGSFFSTLGVRPALGRTFTEADDQRGCAEPGVVVSDAFWHRELGGDPAAVGRTLLLDGQRFTVVGVTPPSFFGVEVGRVFDVAVPICAEPAIRGENSGLDRGDVWFLAMFGRLKPEWTRDRATAQLASISPGIFEATLPARFVPEDAKNYREFKLGADPAGTGVSALRRDYATPLWVLLGVTGLVLLIACANLANLMLARATAREREVAVRLAIGASRRRVIRQMLSESLLIAVIGAAVGVLVAEWLSRFLVGYLSTPDTRLFVDLGYDWRVLAFTTGLAMLACLLFGLAPAVRATRTPPGSAMRTGGRGSTDGRERFGLRRVLVAVQVALSLVLLVGALLFVGSLKNLATVDTGFRQDGIVIANIDVQRALVPQASRTAMFDRIAESVRGLPGVQAAAEVAIVPISGSSWNNRIMIDGVRQTDYPMFNSVGPGFFATLGTPFVAGRDFDARRDVRSSPAVAIVNESFVRKYLSGRNALGRRFNIESAPGAPEQSYDVIGIVRDTKYSDLREDFAPIAFLAASQDPEPGVTTRVIVRSELPLDRITPSITRAVGEIHPAISLTYQTMTAQIRGTLQRERLMALLSGFFGGLAALIATLGLYGVVSYIVARRRIEIGVRMALGADGATVVRMIVKEAAALILAGLIVGAILAVIAGRAAATLLFGLRPWDPATLAVAMALLSTVTLFAGWIPARRAARLEPTVALRED